MTVNCDVIRDLLPLYADKACSESSSRLVEAHLQGCPACRELVGRLEQSEIETALQTERESVLRYGERVFRRRSAAVGSAVSGGILVPVLLLLAVGALRGISVSWIALVAGSLCVLASLTAVPILVPEDKAFWTFCAFCGSLVLLLWLCCLYVHGDWFRIAASGTLFGLSVVFLPFVIRARPVQRLLGGRNRVLTVLVVDLALFFNLLNAIDTRGRFTLDNILLPLCVIAAAIYVGYAIFQNRNTR